MMRFLAACLAAFTMQAATTANDANCDISVTPAGTLLLPYFEVDLAAAGGETAVFTITNTAALPQAVQVTLWTDYAIPVIAFNLYLTGYDVQSVNLFDVIANGRMRRLLRVRPLLRPPPAMHAAAVADDVDTDPRSPSFS